MRPVTTDCRACPPLNFSIPSLTLLLIFLWLPFSLAPFQNCQLGMGKKGYREG